MSIAEPTSAITTIGGDDDALREALDRWEAAAPSPDRRARRADRRRRPTLERTATPRVSVVIPTLNEEANLRHVLPRLPEWIDELVIVDGRSTDGTIAEALRLRPDAVIVTDPEPGKGRALMTGFHASTGDIIVTLDADGSMDPAEIPRYVYGLMAGADFVKGSRFMHGGATEDMGVVRRSGNRALTELVRRLYGGRFSDLCYGYNAMWRDVLPYIEGRAPGFEIETHMNVRALSAQLNVLEVPTFEAPRVNGTSNLRTIHDGFRVLRTILVERSRLSRAALPTVAERRAAVALRATAGAEPRAELASTVSVVICTHDERRWDDLVAAVNSVRRQTVAPVEVLIVVDYDDALLERVRDEVPAVRVVPNDGPKGLSGARNTAVEMASGDVVAFLDDDAHADPDWVERLLAAYAGPNVLAVGGLVLPEWETARPRWMPEEMDWVVGCTYRGLPELRSPVRNVIGANMSFRRSVLAEIGGFDSDLGRQGDDAAGCEETEACIRALQHHRRGQVIFEPSARVWHRVPAERATWRYFVKRCRAEGRSKAHVTTLTGAQDGLSSERAYVSRTLPLALARDAGRALRLDGAGARRSAAVLTGTALVLVEYLKGRSQARGVDAASPGHR